VLMHDCRVGVIARQEWVRQARSDPPSLHAHAGATLNIMTINPAVSAADVAAWTERYIGAWESNSAADIAALFTEDAEYHETPYETHWIGRDEIVTGWRSRWGWQAGGWSFVWTLDSLEGGIAVVRGVGSYARLGDFDNVWTVAFRDAERCESFHMLNTERTA
jgi:hypothetical protein